MKPAFVLFILLCGLVPALHAASPSVIPLPKKIEVHDGGFVLGRETRLIVDAPAQATGEYLAARLRFATGLPLPLENGPAASAAPGTIVLTTAGASAALGPEGYQLAVTTDAVVIRAATAAGLFYGAQTLLQLLPPEVLAAAPVPGVRWTVPGVKIEDEPRFPWRGMLLDVGRHIVAVEDVKRLLDVLALHKLNVFHWHLTEDQGWRIEIKKYPRLTAVGAWRDSSPPAGDPSGSDGRRYGGFYTQEQIRDVVAYAAARHIMVVPEIELPGHSSAAIASYPQLGNDDIPQYAPKVASHWRVLPYVYAPKEETFRFLEDVLTEVCELFPSPYIHIGGDEAPKTQWQASPFAQAVIKRENLKDEHELQSWFIRRIEKFLASKNRRLIGWDEINEGGLPKTATMMVWRDAEWARHALALGNDVIMATTSHTYFDHAPAPAALERAKGPGFTPRSPFLPLAKVYAYDPAFVAGTPAQEKQILGTQGQLWGEYTKDSGMVEYLAFPRLLALAEVAWTPQSTRSFADFQRRLGSGGRQRLDHLAINQHRDTAVEIGAWNHSQLLTANGAMEWDATNQITAPGRFRVCLTLTNDAKNTAVTAAALLEDGREISRDVHTVAVVRRTPDAVYLLDVPAPKPGARYTVRAQISADEATLSAGVVYWDLRPVESNR